VSIAWRVADSVNVLLNNTNPEDPFDFDVHPTNLGHLFIAKQFQDAWRRLN